MHRRPGFIVFYFLILLTATFGCGEEYSQEPPFSQVNDTIFLDVDNWFFYSSDPEIDGGIAYFPFSYNIFNSRFDGYLVNAPTKVYQVDRDKSMVDRVVFLDRTLAAGDTIHTFSPFQYNLLIYRQRSDLLDEEVYYILHRSQLGVKTTRERSIWVVSPKQGILAVSNFNIKYEDGQVTMDMVGDPDFFGDPELLRTIKYYDHNVTLEVDRDRRVVYEFNKLAGRLKSRDVRAKKDLYSYSFNKTYTRELIDFYIYQDNANNTVHLTTGDSCYSFSEKLELLRADQCENLK
ncbi:MAG: hypothetical protein AAF206_16735 [Bacteroidota bacterium]